LQAFLQNNGFVLAEETVDYHVSFKLSISGRQSKLDAVVVLDEDFNLKYVNTPDIKWLCVDIVSANKDSEHTPYDCRFKIHSRAKRTALELRRESNDFADILANHRTMLLRTGNEVRGVHPDFLSRIRFMRKKDTRVYQLAANPYAAYADPFLCGMTIRVNNGTEYSRPSTSGTFEDVDRNRVEVTVIPELPDLRDDDKMRTFFNRSWEFDENILREVLGVCGRTWICSSITLYRKVYTSFAVGILICILRHFFRPQRCNPWPHVTNRHIFISQLL